MIIRMFDTAIDPSDVDRAKEIFRSQVKPAFDLFEGCRGIDMYLGLEEHSGGYVDVAAISHWVNREAIDASLGTPEYTEALADLKKLFQQNPIVRHFETID